MQAANRVCGVRGQLPSITSDPGGPPQPCCTASAAPTLLFLSHPGKSDLYGAQILHQCMQAGMQLKSMIQKAPPTYNLSKTSGTFATDSSRALAQVAQCTQSGTMAVPGGTCAGAQGHNCIHHTDGDCTVLP